MPRSFIIAALRYFLAAILPVFCGVSARAQALDLDRSGLSDVWELIHNATGLDPAADADGDGVSNGRESVAGTNPFDSSSAPKMDPIQMTVDGARIQMKVVPGKRYRLQTTETLCGPSATNWYTETGRIARGETTIHFDSSSAAPNRFFRVLVSDVDTDGDGLNDWEEYQLGLDPMLPSSNGKLDGVGNPLSDLVHAVARLRPSAATGPGPRGGTVDTSLLVYPSTIPEGSGLTAEYFTNSHAIFSHSINFNPTNHILTTNSPVIDMRWGPGNTPNLSNGFWCVRWTGQVLPQYSEEYVFETRSDDGLRLWVNDQLLIDRWVSTGSTTATNRIGLHAGIRYNIKVEYSNRGGSARAQLFWMSLSQPRQIIPSSRLYPSSEGMDPGGITSPLYAVGFVGQPFTYTVTGANSPRLFGATNLPPGLEFNSTNAVISGVPALGGTFEIPLTVSNTIGVSESILHLEVFDAGSSVTREVWLGVGGTNVSDIPLHQPATSTNQLGNLEGITGFADNYAERVRGYFIAPATGNYYFWLAANNSAELWISNDDDPVNKVRRAFVKRATGVRQWTATPTQKSGWLSLEIGKRYYIEILHKAGKGSSDHWSVAWLLDPAGTNNVPGAVVPGFLLAPFVDQPASEIPGALYSANMVAQAGAASTGVGTATLRLSPDGSQAILRFNHTGLSTPVTARHIHADTYLGKNSQGQIIFDIDTATPDEDGSYVWNIEPSGPLSAADIVEIIKQGKAYINIHSVNYPAGEINGHFSLAQGTRVFTPPPPAPVWTDDSSNTNAAARFLIQATFGPKMSDIQSVRKLGYAGWIDRQFKLPTTRHLPNLLGKPELNPDHRYPSTSTFNTWWQHSVTAPDQLRQRVAFALSEIMVVSENGVLDDNGAALSAYYDVLLKHSFGNFRELLEAVTLTPAMGLYLDMRRNDKGNWILGTHPNENYAREILQLFSIGVNRMWPDGTLVLSSDGNLIPTYDQDVIIGYSRVFTGWNYYQPNQANRRLPTNWNPPRNYTNAMVLVPTHHEIGTKRLLDNVVLPAAHGLQADTNSTSFDEYCSNDLELALDAIFQNENVGPFICRQLIQRLVTSHPSRDYLYRVVQKFNDNGRGVRGDMKAVIKAILLDYEARSPQMLASPTFGKQREPVLRVTALARALPAPTSVSGTYRQNGGPGIVITTSRPHRIGPGDDVILQFTSGSPLPGSQLFHNPAISNATRFIVNAPGLATGTYLQNGTTLTVTNPGHALQVGQQIYLTFTSGGATRGVHTVASIVSSSVFTVNTATAGNHSGACLFPKWTGCGMQQSGTTLFVTTPGAHGLAAGNKVYIRFDDGPPSAVYSIAAVQGATRFAVKVPTSGSFGDYIPQLTPLARPPLTRSGNVTMKYNSWQMTRTDIGTSASLLQTPLNSPTVFNFFFPDYRFPGILSAAGLTTPEFQLTSESAVVMQMNYIFGGMFANASNTNGITSFHNGSGAVSIDIGPWVTPAWTSDAGIPALVDALNTRMCAGTLSDAAKQQIVSYVANPRFPYSSPAPTANQMRERARAVAHLIAISPDFTIQR